MYLHIGNHYYVRKKDILGIFDMDNTSTSKRTRLFLEKAQKNGEIVPCDDLPKSFIVCTDEDDRSKKIIYLSQISSQTLLKRAGNIGENYLKRIRK